MPVYHTINRILVVTTGVLMGTDCSMLIAQISNRSTIQHKCMCPVPLYKCEFVFSCTSYGASEHACMVLDISFLTSH